MCILAIIKACFMNVGSIPKVVIGCRHGLPWSGHSFKDFSRLAYLTWKNVIGIPWEPGLVRGGRGLSANSHYWHIFSIFMALIMDFPCKMQRTYLWTFFISSFLCTDFRRIEENQRNKTLNAISKYSFWNQEIELIVWIRLLYAR